MSEQIAIAIIGLTGTVIGVVVGWFLKEWSRARTDRTAQYRDALQAVRAALETSLEAERASGVGFGHREHLAYLMALGRLEPFSDRMDLDEYSRLLWLFGSELVGGMEHHIIEAIKLVDALLSKSPVSFLRRTLRRVGRFFRRHRFVMPP